jgi:hypothetical protein
MTFAFLFGTVVAEAELPSILGQLWLRLLIGGVALSAYKLSSCLFGLFPANFFWQF